MEKEELLKVLKARMEITEIISPDFVANMSRDAVIRWLDNIYKSGFKAGFRFALEEIDTILKINDM